MSDEKGWLSQDRLSELVDIVLDAGFGEQPRRRLLLAGIGAAYHHFPTKPDPHSQILSDVIHLNQKSLVGTDKLPFLVWLDNAINLIGPWHVGRTTLEAARDEIERKMSGPGRGSTPAAPKGSHRTSRKPTTTAPQGDPRASCSGPASTASSSVPSTPAGGQKPARRRPDPRTSRTGSPPTTRPARSRAPRSGPKATPARGIQKSRRLALFILVVVVVAAVPTVVVLSTARPVGHASCRDLVDRDPLQLPPPPAGDSARWARYCAALELRVLCAEHPDLIGCPRRSGTADP